MTTLTLFQSADSNPVNKLVRRQADGTITKAMARHGGRFRARTVAAPDVTTLAEVLREVGARADTCISLSVFRDAPEELIVIPAAELAARLGVAPHEREALAGIHEIDGVPTAARIRESMVSGGWLLFDRDQVDDMPADLAALEFAEWREAIGLLFPGFAAAGCVVVPSTTNRVVGAGMPAGTSCHVFVQVDDPDDIPRAWTQATLRALITEYRDTLLGFAKPKRSRATGEIVATDWWTIFDKSVAAPARLVFDGAPSVRGQGLKVLPATVEAHEGPPLQLAKVRDLMPRKELAAIADALEQIRGTRPSINLTRRSGVGAVTGVEIVTADLRMDLELESAAGRATVGALHAAGAGHTRCQSPFRESESWAAFYNTHRDGTPFVFDSGTGEKHVLQREGLDQMWAVIHSWLGDRYAPRFRYRDGSLFSDQHGKVRRRDVGPTHDLIDRMTLAADAPCDQYGRVKRLTLPGHFRSWLDVAWAELLEQLPTEDETEVASGPAIDEFLGQLTALLTGMYRTNLYGDSWRAFTKSYGSWAYLIAKLIPGQWQRVETFDLWGRVLDDGFQVALLPNFARQVRGAPEIAALSLNQLTRRCRQYGIGTEGDNRISCKGSQLRAAILSQKFVAGLNLSYDLDDALAAALRMRVAESPETPRAS
jgi:hypothetical protein